MRNAGVTGQTDVLLSMCGREVQRERLREEVSNKEASANSIYIEDIETLRTFFAFE